MPNVLIPLAQGCEELEAVTLIDLLRRAGLNVITAGLDKQPVRCSRDTVLIPDTDLDSISAQTFDLVVLPGGLPGADHLKDDPRILQLLSRHAAAGRYVAAICAAPKVLAESGLLDHKHATSYPGALDSYLLDTTQLTNADIEIDDKIITSKGPGTAMDFALTLIELLLGKEKRVEVEKPLCRPEVQT